MTPSSRVEWKQHCPTFHTVLDKIRDFFRMDIRATRLNWYRDSTEWKPFHHDAAAIKEEKAQQSNLTVAVSFGLEREAAFEHSDTKTVISMPQPNGSVYVFARDINVLWRHGILQVLPPCTTLSVYICAAYTPTLCRLHNAPSTMTSSCSSLDAS